MGHLATKTFYCLNMEDIDQSSSKKEPSVPHVPGPNAIDVTPDKDGGVLKDVKHEGVGDELPPLGSNVSVHYVTAPDPAQSHRTLRVASGNPSEGNRRRTAPFQVAQSR